MVQRIKDSRRDACVDGVNSFDGIVAQFGVVGIVVTQQICSVCVDHALSSRFRSSIPAIPAASSMLVPAPHCQPTTTISVAVGCPVGPRVAGQRRVPRLPRLASAPMRQPP